MTTHRCLKCEEIKDESEFHGFNLRVCLYYCKPCYRKWNRERRQLNPYVPKRHQHELQWCPRCEQMKPESAYQPCKWGFNGNPCRECGKLKRVTGHELQKCGTCQQMLPKESYMNCDWGYFGRRCKQCRDEFLSDPVNWQRLNDRTKRAANKRYTKVRAKHNQRLETDPEYAREFHEKRNAAQKRNRDKRNRLRQSTI